MRGRLNDLLFSRITHNNPNTPQYSLCNVKDTMVVNHLVDNSRYSLFTLLTARQPLTQHF